MTGVLDANSNGADCRSRLGFFDDNNGLYFEYTGSTLYIVKRSKVTGSVVNTSVAQSSWNLDPMDGSGVSGVNIDVSKIQIFIIDLQWLGAGKVKLGLNLHGNIYYVHEFAHANIISTTYITRAVLPIRYQITNTGTTNGAGTLKMVCCSIISEGGYELHGIPFAIGLNDNDEISVGTTISPLLSIRLKSTLNRVPAKLLGCNVLTTGSANISYSIYHYLSPDTDPLTGESWVDVNTTHSAMEYDKSATALSLTDAHLIYQGYFSNAQDFDARTFNRAINVTSDIDGTSDIIVLAAQKIGTGTVDVVGSLVWVELHSG